MDQILWLESLDSKKLLHVYKRVSNKGSLLSDFHFHETEDLKSSKLPLHQLKGYIGKKLEKTNFLRNSITMIIQQSIRVL